MDVKTTLKIWAYLLILNYLTLTTSFVVEELSHDSDHIIQTLLQKIEKMQADFIKMDEILSAQTRFEKNIEHLENKIYDQADKLENLVTDMSSSCYNRIDKLDTSTENLFLNLENVLVDRLSKIDVKLENVENKFDEQINKIETLTKEVLDSKKTNNNNEMISTIAFTEKLNSMDNLLEMVNQQTSNITMQVSEFNETLKKTTEVLVENHEQCNISGIYEMIDSLKDGQINVQRDLLFTKNESDLAVEQLDRKLTSKLDVVLGRNSELAESIKSISDFQNRSNDLFQNIRPTLNSMRKTIAESLAPKPQDCSDIFLLGERENGMYDIYLNYSNGLKRKNVYCDMTTSDGGWTVIQRRNAEFVPRINFFRNWVDYNNGFGRVDEEFWLGLRSIWAMTSNRKYTLHIDLEDFSNEQRFAEYSIFSLAPEEERYTLKISDYSGDAGDSMAYQDGRKFSTRDKDTLQKCANLFKGAWWYNSCHKSNLNGLPYEGNHGSYGDGIQWYGWHGYYYSLKSSEMKIRPVSFTPILSN